jgi:tetratricopeptide (TPR) repeat protein
MVKRYDYLGNQVTADSKATVAGIDDFIGGVLGYETRAGNILKIADADPGCCLANAYAGMLWMLAESPRLIPRAQHYLDRAIPPSANATKREKLVVRVLERWIAGDIPSALALGDTIVAEFPRDLLTVKLHQFHAFNLGNAEEMLRIAVTVARTNADIPQMHSMLAFGFEENNMLREAELAARQAMSQYHRDPWAHHTLAHVMLAENRIEEGIEFLESVSWTWTGLTSFMSTHAWWHLALLYLAQNRVDAALYLYDTHIWGIEPDYAQDQIGAVSLLARLEMAGLDVGKRWDDVADHLTVRQDDTLQPFNTLHYLYGLARAGRPEAATLLQAIKQRAENAPSFSAPVWRDVAVPLAEGLTAYVSSDFAGAAAKLGSVLPRLSEIGGSHAQRDLFQLIHRDAERVRPAN